MIIKENINIDDWKEVKTKLIEFLTNRKFVFIDKRKNLLVATRGSLVV